MNDIDRPSPTSTVETRLRARPGASLPAPLRPIAWTSVSRALRPARSGPTARWLDLLPGAAQAGLTIAAPRTAHLVAELLGRRPEEPTATGPSRRAGNRAAADGETGS